MREGDPWAEGCLIHEPPTNLATNHACTTANPGGQTRCIPVDSAVLGSIMVAVPCLEAGEAPAFPRQVLPLALIPNPTLGNSTQDTNPGCCHEAIQI